MKKNDLTVLSTRKDTQLAQCIISIMVKYHRVAVVGAKITDVSFCIQALINHARSIETKSNRNEFIFILKGDNTFDELTVAESIYFRERQFFGTRRRAILQQCIEAFDRFGLNLDLTSKISTLKREEKKIVESMRAYLLTPKYIISDDTMAEFGFNFTEKYIRIINDCVSREPASKTLYCTTRWEEAIKIADHIIVINNEKIEGTYDKPDVIKNPRQIVNELMGGHIAEAKNNDKNEDFEVLNTIFKGAEFLTSSFELGSTLEFIANNIRKTIDCLGCAVYLNSNDKAQGKVISYFDKNTAQSRIQINYDSIKRYFDQNKDVGVLYVSERDKDFSDFISHTNKTIKTLFGLPILLKSKKIGYLIIWYDNYYVYSEKQILILSAFTNEVAIIVETARLMNRSLLLQESHHRIKNNLQIIISLLYMQKAHMTLDNDAAMSDDVIKSMVNRVKSIAVVHDLLADTQNNQIVNARDLLLDVLGFYHCETISIQTDIEEVYIAQKSAVSIALIMNEIINNCIKHAFSGLSEDYDKRINISMHINEDDVIMIVKDNGVGMPGYFKDIKSLGITIMRMLVKQEFKGRLDIKVNGGTTVEITLPKGKVFSTFTY